MPNDKKMNLREYEARVHDQCTNSSAEQPSQNYQSVKMVAGINGHIFVPIKGHIHI